MAGMQPFQSYPMQGYSPAPMMGGQMPIQNNVGYDPMVYNQDRMGFLQGQLNQLRQPVANLGLSGKVVESIDVVKATDIPMDGNMYYFPKADGTEVYSKRWLPNGKTEVVTYKTAEEVAVQEETSNNEVLEKLNSIDERLVKLERILGRNNKNTKREDAE